MVPIGAVAFMCGLSASSPKMASYPGGNLVRDPRINSECSRLKTPGRQRGLAVTARFFAVPLEDMALKSIMRGK